MTIFLTDHIVAILGGCPPWLPLAQRKDHASDQLATCLLPLRRVHGEVPIHFRLIGMVRLCGGAAVLGHQRAVGQRFDLHLVSSGQFGQQWPQRHWGRRLLHLFRCQNLSFLQSFCDLGLHTGLDSINVGREVAHLHRLAQRTFLQIDRDLH